MTFFSRSFAIVARAAASESASPPNVTEKKISSKTSMISRRPTTAASGNPLAIALPKQARSGTTPNRSWAPPSARRKRSEEHTSELQSLAYLVCRLLLEKKKKKTNPCTTYYSRTLIQDRRLLE